MRVLRKDSPKLPKPKETEAGLSPEKLEQEERVRKALEKLPQIEREVVVLAFYQGLSCREIAAVLGVPEGTVKSRMFWAKRRLRELLAPEGAGTQPQKFAAVKKGRKPHELPKNSGASSLVSGRAFARGGNSGGFCISGAVPPVRGSLLKCKPCETRSTRPSRPFPSQARTSGKRWLCGLPAFLWGRLRLGTEAFGLSLGLYVRGKTLPVFLELRLLGRRVPIFEYGGAEWTRSAKKRDEVEELREVLDIVSERVPALLRGIRDVLYSKEAAENMAEAVATFYEKLVAAGVPAKEVLGMTKRYMVDLRSLLGGKHSLDLGDLKEKESED